MLWAHGEKQQDLDTICVGGWGKIENDPMIKSVTGRLVVVSAVTVVDRLEVVKGLEEKEFCSGGFRDIGWHTGVDGGDKTAIDV